MATFTGTKGDDVLTGTTVSDTFFASQGNDAVSGGTGTDRLTINLWNTSLFDQPTGARTYSITSSAFTDSSGLINTSMSSVERISFIDTGTGDFGDTLDASSFVTNPTTAFVLLAQFGSGNDVVTGTGYNDNIVAGGGTNWIDAGGGSGDSVRFSFDNDGGQTLYVSGSGGTATFTLGGILVDTVLNAEMIIVDGGDPNAGTTIDASALTGFNGTLYFDDTNGSNVFIGHNGSDLFANVNFGVTGGDTYTGNGGADIYDYTFAVGSMNGDLITDFDSDDVIDLTYNDAVNNGGSARATHFIGTAEFSGAIGEYRYEIIGDHTIVQADTDGDGTADQTLTIANGAFALGETAAGSNMLHITGYSPVNSVPGAQQTDENASLTFASGAGNALSVSDADIGGGNLTVTLSVAHGMLTLGGYTGLSFSDGDGTGDSTMTFAGTAEAINAALEGLTYVPEFGFEGDDSLTVTTNDNGSAGLQDVDAVTITVNSIDSYGTDDSDFMVGTKGNDYIHALGGNDTIAATSGFDFNDGGDGYDQLRFVTGNTARFDQPWDSRTITITNDWVGASDGTINSYYFNIESLYFSTTNTGNHGDTIDASALTSTPLILRLGAGNDAVTGGGGDDDIALGLGVNSADAGDGNDTVRATFNNSAGATAYVTNSGGTIYVTADGVQTAAIVNAETVLVSGYYSSGATTTIDASGFTAMPGVTLVLADSNGSDVIIGSHGNDILANTSGFTSGSDSFTGNGGADVFDYTYASDDMNGDVITDLDADDTIDFRFNDGNVPGASPLLMNHFIGNADFSGSAGEYRYEVVDYETFLEADTDGDGVADQVMTIANGGFVLSETSAGSNILQITGISGSDGDDFLLGGLGDDSIYAQGGNDTIATTQGADYVDGGDGFDQLRFQTGFPDRFAPATGPRTYTITADHVGDSSGTVDTSFTNIESIFLRTIGNGDYGDTIDASALTGAGLILRLGAGNDTVIGSAGNDDIGLNLGINIADAGDGYDIVYTAFDNQSGATAYVTSSGGTVLVTVGGVQVASIVNGEQVHITGGYSSGATTTIDASTFYAIPDVTLVLRDSNGSDVIIGSHGNDYLSNVGLNSLGSDTFTGNGGADVFDWTYASDNMHGDVITDLDDDDTLDFRFNDGNVAGASPLVMNHFIGGGYFSGTAGEYRFEIVGNTTQIQADTDGDGVADQVMTISNGAFMLDETSPGSNVLHITTHVITGTNNGETLNGTYYNDNISALGGGDTILASQGYDNVDGGSSGFNGDRLTINLANASLFDVMSGARGYTIGATSFTDSIGYIHTNFTDIERFTFNDAGTGDHDDWLDASGIVSTYADVGAVLNATMGNGNNNVTGSNYRDVITTGSGNDVINTGGGNDTVLAGLGTNTVDAGAGTDEVRVTFDNSSGQTLYVTGSGSTLNTAVNGVTTNSISNAETVSIMLSDFNAPTTVIDASAVTNFAGALVFYDNNGTNIDIGHNGADLFANVTGGHAGSDTYTGNGGADTYDYTYAADAMNGDTIVDLDSDDVIDFRFNSLNPGGSPLRADHFIGAAAFSGTAGEYRFQVSGNQTLIQLDSNGDGVADQVLTIANGAFNIAETAPGSNILHMVGQVATGTSGNDTLYSSSGDDIVNSLGGNDFIYGSQGHDTIDGGANTDRLVFLTFDSTRFAAAIGDRIYTVTANHVSDSSGTIDTSFTSVERINILTNTNGNFNDTFDLSGFVTNPNIGAVAFITTGNGNNTIIGSNYSDSLKVGSGHNVVDGGGGYDYGFVALNDSNPATVYITSSGNTLITTQAGIQTNALTNVEEIQLYAQGTSATFTMDASAYVNIPGTQLILTGHNGTDVMIGSAGNDIFANITGQVLGNDVYTGNGGADTFDYTYAADSMNGDTITDLDADDVIDMRFNSLNTGGSPLRADHFIGAAAFSGTAGEYRYQISSNQTLIQLDSNGDGIADQTLTIANGAFAIVETAPGSNILKLGAAFPGTAGDDTLFGTAGNDTINALAGNDFLKGGTGDDVLNGGAGIDRAGFYTTDPTLGGVSVSLLLQGSAQNTHQGWDTLTGIENVSGTPFADVLLGDSGNNWLWGSAATIAPGNVSTANNDWLDGGAGNDVLTVGTGNHTLIGGAGNDTLVFTENGAPETGVTISLLQATVQVTGNGSWTISGIENVVGGTANDSLTGDGFANILAGQAGTDMLVGGQGNDTLLGDGTIDVDGTVRESGFGSGDDTLDGGLGADRMVGGLGNDLYYVDNAGDTVVEAAGEGYDTIQTSLSSYTMADNAERLNTSVSGSFTGNASDNLMVAGAANTSLSGGGGNDTLQLLSGNNTASGGAGNDTLIVSFASATAAIKMLAPSATGDGSIATSNKSETTNFTGIENFTITTGSGNDSIVTGNGNDSISTGAGTDTLKSGAGNDMLDGGAGADTMAGGANDDTYVVDNAGDVVTELAGEGTDLVRILTSAATLTYRLAANVENMIVASATAATLYDNALNNVITGGALADTISAEAGGNDVLAGGGGADSFVLGTALTGADVIDGGIGSDTLSLKGSYDLTFGATTMTNVETLLLQSSTLVGHHYTLAMSDANVAAGTVLTVNGSALANDEVLRFSGSAETDGRFDITGGAAGDFLTGGAGADVIRGGAGADQINGGAGNDTLTGGNGTDTFIFGPNSGIDHITDFAKAEVIALNGIAGVDDYSDLHIVMDGPNAMISWGTSDSIILDGVKASSLSAANFSFSATAPQAALASFDPSGGGIQHLMSFDAGLHADVVPVL